MRLELYPNLTGMAGTRRTIAHMRRLVEVGKTDPRVVLQAHKIIRGIDRNNWNKMATAIFKFVHDKVEYVRDPVGVEFVKSPGITLQTKTGDCDDQSVLYSALAESVGLKTRFKTVKADGKYPDEYSHVYAQAFIPGVGWRAADTIVPYATFGWEAKNFPSKTWGSAMNGLSYVDSKDANWLGDAYLAAGSVGYDDDVGVDGGSSFGAAFDGDDADEDVSSGPKYAGGMWDTLPMLASPDEKIDTIVDADNDFWGGATDTSPGPGFRSRMLSPGVGGLEDLGVDQSLNGIQLGYGYDGMGNLCLGYYDGMGFRLIKRLRKRVRKAITKVTPKPFRRIQARIRKRIDTARTRVNKKLLSPFKKASQAIQKVGKKLGQGIGLSTSETRQKASRKAVEEAMSQTWNDPATQTWFNLLYRVQDMLGAVQEGRVPKFVKGPPVGTESKPKPSDVDAVLAEQKSSSPQTTTAGLNFVGEMLRARRLHSEGMGAWVAAIAAAAKLAKASGQKKDVEAATKAVEKYVSGFPMDKFNTITQNAATAYIAAGGMMPSPEDVPPEEWKNQWLANVRAGKDDKYTGWNYHYMYSLMKDLNASIPKLQAAKQVLGAAYEAHTQQEGPQTVQAASNVVQDALNAGTIEPNEVQMALEIAKKKAEGFKLTADEQALAAKIVAGARKKKGSGGLLIAIPAAAATAAALLL